MAFIANINIFNRPFFFAPRHLNPNPKWIFKQFKLIKVVSLKWIHVSRGHPISLLILPFHLCSATASFFFFVFFAFALAIFSSGGQTTRDTLLTLILLPPSPAERESAAECPRFQQQPFAGFPYPEGSRGNTTAQSLLARNFKTLSFYWIT